MEKWKNGLSYKGLKMDIEKPASYYDAHFKKRGVADRSLVKPLFMYMKNQIKNLKIKTILDIGCGDGYALAICRNMEIDGYGFDFSSEAIKVCKNHYKLKNVWVGDAREENNYINRYDAYLCTEVLEHVTLDLDIIGHLKSNLPFIFSVPSWMGGKSAHVRCFKSDEQIIRRYGQIIDIKSIKKIGTRRAVVSITK